MGAQPVSKVYPRYISVDVTQEDFQKGVRGDCDECAVALALKRQFPYLYVVVFVHSARIGEMDYMLTKATTDLVVNWDRGLYNGQPATARLYNPTKRLEG